MIKKKTVFVLGAGASAPYGFPLGGRLIEAVIDGLLRRPMDQFAVDVMEASECTQGQVEVFAQHLRDAGRDSIDEFLLSQEQYREIGKTAIARALMPFEHDGALEPHAPKGVVHEPDQCWYQYCFNNLLRSDSGTCALKRNNLTVVTFNFDRSFERALFLFVCANCVTDRNESEASRIAQEIPVHYIHERLGAPSWLDNGLTTEDDHARSYEPTLRSAAVRNCAESIRILGDEIESGPTLENARGALREADQVCFLGFSYHPTNLARLKIRVLRGKHILGTAYEMPDGPRGQVKRAFKGIDEFGIRLRETARDEDILKFLTETDVLHE